MNDMGFGKLDSDFATFKKRPKPELRYIKPPIWRETPERFLKYSIAEDLAKDLEIEKGSRAFVVLNGTFIAGDFIEALILCKGWKVPKLTISSLSLSENNVDSFAGLLDSGAVAKLDMIVSDYFYSHERHNLVPYMYKELDKDDRFQLAAAGTHCKIALIETECGKKVCIHGSANLRSSGNIEQIVVEENGELYDFNLEYQSQIIERYKTINKSIRHDKLWQAVQM